MEFKMKAIERIIDKAHLDRKRVVLSEAEDPRVLAAARMAIVKQLAYITLVRRSSLLQNYITLIL